MSIRSNWCEFDKETRKYIKKRDKDKCIYCGNDKTLQIAHIFLSRAKGGKGNKENGVLACVKCHSILDNPIGKIQSEMSLKMDNKAKQYLIEQENINYNKDFINSLKYKKEVPIFKIEEIEKETFIKRCKNCKSLVKNKNSNSNNSIPSYYCKYKRTLLNKNTKACNNYKEVEYE